MATLYHRIADQYLGAIRSGTLRAGDRFPSVRQLMRTHEVSLSTALQACRRLEDEGWLEARARSGYFVRQPRRAALPPSSEPRPDAIDAAAYVGIQAHISSILARGQQHPVQLNLALAVAPPALYPADALARILQRRVRQQPLVLTTMARRHGHPLLRSSLARRALERGVTAAPEDIIVTQGSTEALNLALRAVTQPGDTVAVESPTFYGLLQIIEALGLRAIEIPTSPQQGLSIEALAFALEHGTNAIQALITMPTLHNPLGCTMPDARKQALVELCARHGLPIIEDDIYSETGDDDRAARSLKAWDTSGIVMHCNSLNKVLAPGLRLGWMLPGRWRSRVEMLKYTQSRFPEELSQATVAEFIASPAYDRHVRRLRSALRAARERMAEAVATHFPSGTRLSVPPGGMLLWVELPAGVSGDAVFDAALERGIKTSPGSMFSNGRRFDGFLRLSCGAAVGTDVTPALRELGAIAGG
jgi:DNA-binding transcriptional MocR family regulator